MVKQFRGYRPEQIGHTDGHRWTEWSQFNIPPPIPVLLGGGGYKKNPQAGIESSNLPPKGILDSQWCKRGKSHYFHKGQHSSQSSKHQQCPTSYMPWQCKPKNREAKDEGDNGDDSDNDNDTSGIACMHLALTSLLCVLCTERTGSTWCHWAAVAWSGYHCRDGPWQDTCHPWSLLQRSWHKNLNEDVNKFSHWRVSSSMIGVSKSPHPPTHSQQFFL